jgi:hypothetical protein
MSRLDGQPFGLDSLSILERNGPTGLSLTLAARHHETGAFFEEEFPFDLNTTTYDTFNVAAADSRFASVDYVTFVSVESPFVDPSETNFIIDRAAIVLPGPNPVLGDYNGNGTVDAADYAVWRDTFGQTGGGLVADGNGNNEIDAGDYDFWRANFGQPASSGSIASANATVPEPATLAMLILAAVGIRLLGRRIA